MIIVLIQNLVVCTYSSHSIFQVQYDILLHTLTLHLVNTKSNYLHFPQIEALFCPYWKGFWIIHQVSTRAVYHFHLATGCAVLCWLFPSREKKSGQMWVKIHPILVVFSKWFCIWICEKKTSTVCSTQTLWCRTFPNRWDLTLLKGVLNHSPG